MIPVALWSVLVLEGLLLFVGTGALITGLRRQWRVSATGQTGAPTVVGAAPQPVAEQQQPAVVEETGEPVAVTASTDEEQAGALASV